MSRSLLIAGLLFSIVVHVILMRWPAPAAAPSAAPAPPVIVPVLETELARLDAAEPTPAPVVPPPSVEASPTELANHDSLAPLFDQQDGAASPQTVEPQVAVEPQVVVEPQLLAESEPLAAPEPAASAPKPAAIPESLARAEPEAPVVTPQPVEPERVVEPEPIVAPDRLVEAETVEPPDVVAEPIPTEPEAETPALDPWPPAPEASVATSEQPETRDAAASDAPRSESVASAAAAPPAPPIPSPAPRDAAPRDGGRTGAAGARHQPVLRIDWGTVAYARATIDAGEMRMVVLAEGREGPIIVGEIVEDGGTWRRGSYQPAAGSTRYSNRLRVVDDVPAFHGVRRDSPLAVGEHLAVLVPVVLERRFESAQLEAAFSRGLSMQQIGSFGGRFDLHDGTLRFQITQVGEDRQ